MFATVRLTVETGPHKGTKYCFRGTTKCLIGRSPDCFVHMAGTDRDRMISRHHCELAIDPTSIRIQDLGSSNGTYVNGTPVEATETGLMECAQATGSMRHELTVQSGDLLTIGGTTFQVDIVECPPKGKDGSRPIIWKDGETSKKNCPIDCTTGCYPTFEDR